MTPSHKYGAALDAGRTICLYRRHWSGAGERAFGQRLSGKHIICAGYFSSFLASVEPH